jgi:hypothetical protein
MNVCRDERRSKEKHRVNAETGENIEPKDRIIIAGLRRL